jgi:hypothetical protein
MGRQFGCRMTREQHREMLERRGPQPPTIGRVPSSMRNTSWQEVQAAPSGLSGTTTPRVGPIPQTGRSYTSQPFQSSQSPRADGHSMSSSDQPLLHQSLNPWPGDQCGQAGAPSVFHGRPGSPPLSPWSPYPSQEEQSDGYHHSGPHQSAVDYDDTVSDTSHFDGWLHNPPPGSTVGVIQRHTCAGY